MHYMLDPRGIHHCYPGFARLGHRGSRPIFTVDRTLIQHDTHSDTGLSYFPIDEVFLDHESVLIACGTPNMATIIRRDNPDKPGWDQFAAFMFYRQDACVANTRGRIQSGITFEVRHLPEKAREAIRFAMEEFTGKRGPSCARLNAQMLACAGFTFGNGQSLVTATRPSKFVSLGWRYGLAYNGEPVDIRIVVTGDKPVSEHMKAVWLKETVSACRTVKKKYAENKGHTPAPVFEAKEFAPINAERWSGRETTICTNRPSWLGVKLSFLLGQQPVYSVQLDELGGVAELRDPLSPFPGKLDRVTKLKKYLLFSRPVIAAIRRSRIKTNDCFEGIPARAALEMLLASESADSKTAVLYNCVVMLRTDGTGEARITGLRNQDPRTKVSRWIKTISWILAKHVLISGYDPGTVYACELWTYKDKETGETVLCINSNSGTYKPNIERMEAIASYLRELFGVRVRTFEMDPEESKVSID